MVLQQQPIEYHHHIALEGQLSCKLWIQRDHVFSLVDEKTIVDSMELVQKWVCEFEKPKGNPTAFIKPATTVLSPYLKVIFLITKKSISSTQSFLVAVKGHYPSCLGSMLIMVTSC
jgi:hypothetical protein